ncbi:maleate cis-trans isomerase family protein [Thermicanus aegyptius]|uniref:maleate cis-trans isomerase family protein n=1 Tax=Thermicanus aegyptius TaxID=94009 RepID=UPI0024801090|nr:aspartate/glutamate racemase family protein [Thermicanus aegyptius]
MLTPSSNTVLEPVCQQMLSCLDDVSVHFSRFTVTEISMRPNALGQFEQESMLRAARLLADAEVDVIAWNGTSAGWLGFEADVRLCERIFQETGIPATTSVLALNEAFELYGIKSFGLVTPYTPDINEKIIANYSTIGLECAAEQCLGMYVNKEFSRVSPKAIEQMVAQVAVPGVEAITTFCTNLRAAPLVQSLEQKYGIPIFDTISVVVWKSLNMIGISPDCVQGWGGLFKSEEANEAVQS